MASAIPESSSDKPDVDGPTITGSWFVGAFGKWWLAGTVQLLRKDLMLLSKTVGSAAGILNMRAFDNGELLERRFLAFYEMEYC